MFPLCALLLTDSLGPLKSAGPVGSGLLWRQDANGGGGRGPGGGRNSIRHALAKRKANPMIMYICFREFISFEHFLWADKWVLFLP